MTGKIGQLSFVVIVLFFFLPFRSLPFLNQTKLQRWYSLKTRVTYEEHLEFEVCLEMLGQVVPFFSQHFHTLNTGLQVLYYNLLSVQKCTKGYIFIFPFAWYLGYPDSKNCNLFMREIYLHSTKPSCSTW